MGFSNPSSGNSTEVERKNPVVEGIDIEQHAVAESHLVNTTVKNISWKGVTVTVKDRETKEPKNIVDNVEGIVEAGEILALMGPSGSGKTSLLNMLAMRHVGRGGATTTSGSVLINGQPAPTSTFRQITRFVEQEDHLIGSLTVMEELNFSSRLAIASKVLPKKERIARIEGLLDAFGLREQKDTLIGTPIRKGISGGQKRRVGVASQLITCPRILFLDEPTSGLDSKAGWEVIKYLKGVARRNNLIVIASIHQPSTATFNLFDKIMLLSAGKTHYFGPVAGVTEHYESLGHEVPLHVNPAEFLLDLVNIDFASEREEAVKALDDMQTAWRGSEISKQLTAAVAEAEARGGEQVDTAGQGTKPSLVSSTVTLLHRSFVKSYRDVVAYGIRAAMYFGLAIMVGTVWVRLDAAQESIIPFINALFFGCAFMSFMAVAYCPAWLEDYFQYIKERRNGLYGPTALIISNFLIGIPYLFLFSLLFSVISYWLVNFQPTAKAFFTWVFWLFCDLLAAEGLVVFMSSLFPSFVISLALVAFANGLWMSVDGFMVQPTVLNVFYKYVFHYWDYQKYVFENMMINEFRDRVYTCGKLPEGMMGLNGSDCQCMFQTDLADQCLIRGQGVLDQYGYKPGKQGRDIGIMFCIIVGWRLAAWVVLKLKK
ncbi:P-loop containing nucleoside triphosphate hydrolase protein [Pseudoneurospora amorphoporcata]|uniref:P-loop containing nucleoside triphosphate hydrolase protein n=1 Tax=Pseudoneurospora amorphoporcata TaxID=241081 RepID=A0AAN6NY54_9PEZI|nr:P-loop containing nucleoside triphosphate hydrolase protein [Pseudoneurospora amorphoporcata]